MVKAPNESDHMAHSHISACIWICMYVDYEGTKKKVPRRNNLSANKQDCIYNARQGEWNRQRQW